MGSILKRGENDLLTQRPDLADEWHPTKNGLLTPNDVCAHSGKSVWWQIKTQRFGKEFTLEWEALISNRANGSGCPYTCRPPKKLLKGFNDLQSLNPHLANMWHPSKNGDITPDMIFEGTEKKYWWYHKSNRWGKEFPHEWQASPKDMSRCTKSNGCPICHGAKVLQGYNDLFTCCPEIAEEWDFKKNALLDISPSSVTVGSNLKVYWLCKHCGHSWKAMILSRTSKHTNCPKCAQRSQTSFPEQAIYYYFKQCFTNCVSRSKDVVECGELDVFLPNEKFAIEYCGLFSHSLPAKKEADINKKLRCQKNGITLVQIYENECENKLDINQMLIYCVPKYDNSHLSFVFDCLNQILKILNLCDHPISINIAADEIHIREQYQQMQINNSIITTHQYLLEEWDYEKNGLLKPEGFTAGSGTKVFWKHMVEKDGTVYPHTWQAKISQRARGEGCPICAGKIVQEGYNDLLSRNPDFLKEWDYIHNEISPNQITRYSNQKVWWQHFQLTNGQEIPHRWQATVKERMQGNGCSICAGKTIQKNINDLGTTHPELLLEWDYHKNTLSPYSISFGYDKKVWWKHSVIKDGKPFEHSWEASPNSRTNSKSNCPYCANKKVLIGYNDLLSLLPEIASKWDYDKNHPFKPENFTIASGKKVYWIDRKKPIRISDRTKKVRK